MAIRVGIGAEIYGNDQLAGMPAANQAPSDPPVALRISKTGELQGFGGKALSLKFRR